MTDGAQAYDEKRSKRLAPLPLSYYLLVSLSISRCIFTSVPIECPVLIKSTSTLLAPRSKDPRCNTNRSCVYLCICNKHDRKRLQGGEGILQCKNTNKESSSNSGWREILSKTNLAKGNKELPHQRKPWRSSNKKWILYDLQCICVQAASNNYYQTTRGK